jgi:sulfur transfer protein SufE
VKFLGQRGGYGELDKLKQENKTPEKSSSGCQSYWWILSSSI